MPKRYKAMVLSCIDPRFQSIVYNHLNKKRLKGKYSSFVIAGGSIGVTSKKFKSWHKTFWENLFVSIKLHKINKLIVINHFDCSAAKIINGKKIFNLKNERKIHQVSFLIIKKIFKKKYPNLKIDLNIISLKKKIEKF
jgi:carbonic anhydrase|tara:strand:- start:643 stop:1056 length:414 start_codon:yes stop_codon:yes gene_type:complete